MSEGASETVEQFIASRGLDSLAERPVEAHGRTMTFTEALVGCEPFKKLIDAHIEAVREIGGEDVDILPHVTKYIDRIGEQAQKPIEAPAPTGAGKK